MINHRCGFASFVLAATFASHVGAFDFSVEDPQLIAAPAELSRLLQSKTDYKDRQEQPCNFIGKRINLHANRSEANDWVFTTDKTCGWTASKGPIVVVQDWAKGFLIVLDVLAYDLTIGKPHRNGLYNVATGAATARIQEFALWTFDGSAYQLKSIKAD
jgi:hypothetical protein